MMTLLLVGMTLVGSLKWTQLTSIPDPKGFAGPFAGVSHGHLLVGGGANFPEKPPWEGGKKVWYNRIYALDRPTGKWTLAGNLPRSLGYGVSVTYGDRVICVGGSDAKRHYADAFSLEWTRGRIVRRSLPSLPVPIANGCGALVGSKLYVMGGQGSPTSVEAGREVFTLDLARKGAEWHVVSGFPGAGRILATAAGFGGSFWVFGGASLHVGTDGVAARTYLRDAHRYNPKDGWKRIADLPGPVVAAPSPAPVARGSIYVLGGDDGARVGMDPRTHPGFSKGAIRYDPAADRWLDAGEMPVGSVTAPTVQWRGMWVIPNGERRPGVRSPEVWGVAP